MRRISLKGKNLILILVFTALAIAMGCVFAACTKAQAEESAVSELSALDLFEISTESGSGNDAAAAAENYSRWLSDHYSAKIYTREMWLTDLLRELKPDINDSVDGHTVFDTARENHIIDSVEAEPYTALTRRYVAETLFKALGYHAREARFVTDIGADDKALAAMAYYGFFIPDDAGRLHPDAPITEEEYHALLTEVQRYRQLRGKRVLSFGDSIMFGMGNNEKGISDMIAEKYGMTAYDYAVSGATFGLKSGRSHIADQILSASGSSIKSDVILINGGTNDTVFVNHGKMVGGSDPKNFDEKTFAGGFEYSAYLLRKYWKNVPVVYIRAHHMVPLEEEDEKKYGATALRIAEKWRLEIVDIFSDTEFSTERADMREAYTMYRDKLGQCDGIHPTARGYAKYYLPLVSEKVSSLLK